MTSSVSTHGLFRVAIVTLAQVDDFPTAYSSLYTVTQQLSERRRRFLLLNDHRTEPLVTNLSALPWTEVITPGRNLGVATGRNEAIKAALAWEPDLIVVIDDDIFAPCDYLDRVEERLGPLTADQDLPALAIAAPVVVDYHALAATIHQDDEIAAVETGRAESFRADLTTEDLRSAWRSLDPYARKKAVHHMGVRRWRSHYFAALGDVAPKLRSVLRSVVAHGEAEPRDATELRRDDSAIESGLSGDTAPVPVDSVAGGVSIFPAATFRSLGLLEEAFTPFGYEDAEIGIRATRAGMTVVLLPSEILLHDLQSRHKERAPLITAATRGKARAILIRRHGGSTQSTVDAIVESFILGWAEITMYRDGEGGASAGALAYAAGAISGLFRDLNIPLTVPVLDRISPPLVRFGSVLHSSWSGPDESPLRFPRTYSGSATILMRFAGGVENGLPRELVGEVSVSYCLDESGTLDVRRLAIEFPGMFLFDMSAELSGVAPGDESPDALLAGTRLRRLHVEVTDQGLIDRLEETHAWMRGAASGGRLLEIARPWPGPLGSAVKEFLTPWSTERRLVLSVCPTEPVSPRDLMAVAGGPWHVRRRLGLRVWAEQARRVVSVATGGQTT